MKNITVFCEDCPCNNCLTSHEPQDICFRWCQNFCMGNQPIEYEDVTGCFRRIDNLELSFQNGSKIICIPTKNTTRGKIRHFEINL